MNLQLLLDHLSIGKTVLALDPDEQAELAMTMLHWLGDRTNQVAYAHNQSGTHGCWAVFLALRHLLRQPLPLSEAAVLELATLFRLGYHFSDDSFLSPTGLPTPQIIHHFLAKCQN